ncbi:hypothetical protein EYF80_027391 [Liparis tanakae]|uniref:Uncharacterized protein n=1 Tax=Liparis tanakae TaxID=230148 RepID=A0A4Z2HA38_9TELE|nr:hypothetical protein EYF80_027391 [Liparis tanakae]
MEGFEEPRSWRESFISQRDCGVKFPGSAGPARFKAGHLFPVCNMTPASDWVLLLRSCDPGSHVQPIRANQNAAIRAWRGVGGSVAEGEV